MPSKVLTSILIPPKEQIDVLVKEIESSQSGLKARVGTLDKMFDAVQDEYKQLGVYIAAGQLKQQDIQQQISSNRRTGSANHTADL